MPYFAFVSTKAVLVRKNRPTFGVHIPKAPSGRELPTKSGEGERVTIELVQIQSCAGSFRHASRATFLPEEGLYCDRKQDGVIFKGFSEMEKLPRSG